MLHLRQTIILCYEVFERNYIIKTTAANFFFKKVRWLSYKCFSTRAQYEFKSETNMKKFTCNDLYSTKKGL